MFDIGFLELLLVGVVALLVLGPERLPVAARKAGLWIGRMRRFTAQISQEVEKQLKAEELREKLRKEGDQLGLEKIQKTVDDALGEARKFEHLVNKDVNTQPMPGPDSGASVQPSNDAATHARTTTDRTPD
jgi:sec-independent protein translocase protein TatB